MDHAFAIEKLHEFLQGVNEHIDALEDRLDNRTDAWPEFPQRLLLQEVWVRQIENAYAPGLGDYDEHGGDDWYAARAAAIQALGLAQSAEAIAAFLRPTSPALAADTLHDWVWEPAAPLWAAEAYQDAVLAAARTVNRRLQQKLGRHDVSEYDLIMQAFDLKDPVAGKPRLRAPGSRTAPSWRARQEGAKFIAAGAFLAIRNLAAHEDEVNWSPQEALEYLATFSVVARWIEECAVETAS
ncbi:MULTISPECIES: TIGR02391 family protein [unclassified Streptomyces]|uniref:TIGR02391 family protein n=1 Tax=unclassified Streptomyces TaxID=2593676 RepID=UPI003702F85A